MKKLVLVICMLFCFSGISEAKIYAPILAIGKDLTGVILNPGQSVILATVPNQDYHFVRVRCITYNSGGQVPGVYMSEYLSRNLIGGFSENWWQEVKFIGGMTGDIVIKNGTLNPADLTGNFCIVEFIE